MGSKVKTFAYFCEDWGEKVFILVRSPFKKLARAKVIQATNDLETPLKNWDGIILNDETSEAVLRTHKLNTLYYAD